MPVVNVKRVLRKLGIVFNSLPNTSSIIRAALFHGDIPLVHRSTAIGQLDGATVLSGGCGLNFVCCKEYDFPKPVFTTHRNITYTPRGYAWAGRKVDTSISAREAHSIRFLVNDRLQKRGGLLEQGTIIESQYPYTYGDWTSEHMKSIALCPDFPRPLVLPKEFAGRAYVERELSRCDIDYIIIDQPVLIRNVTVLHKPRPITVWNADDVAAYRRLFGIVPPEPRPGSILYLSRLGVKSEQKLAERNYRSDVIARIVTSLGGRVVQTEGLTAENFSEFAGEAETVIADHGAALFNILRWNPRNIIEIVSDNWWDNCFVFLGTSCGVANHAVVRSEGRSVADLHAILEGHLTRFGVNPVQKFQMATDDLAASDRN